MVVDTGSTRKVAPEEGANVIAVGPLVPCRIPGIGSGVVRWKDVRTVSSEPTVDNPV